MTAAPVDPTSLVEERALALGFDIVGIARADEPLGVEHERYQAFVDRGMHGVLGWLADHGDARRRLDGAEILAGARSVICVGRRYARTPPPRRRTRRSPAASPATPAGRTTTSSSARSSASSPPSCAGSGPASRRAPSSTPSRCWSAPGRRAPAIGFVGKNGLVITPGQGSYQILGEVVTTLALVPDTPIAERCGSCTRCLDACPTQAFPEPFVLDARRCISYWTIEQPDAPPADLRAAIGEHLFGCDVCQEVCPFNRTAPPPAEKTAPLPPARSLGLARSRRPRRAARGALGRGRRRLADVPRPPERRGAQRGAGRA